MKTPTTTEEWQNVVNLADMLLGLDSARQYGLVQGGSATNVIRCQKLIKEGAEQGVKPNWSNDHAAAFICEVFAGEFADEFANEMEAGAMISAGAMTAFVRTAVAKRREVAADLAEDGAPENPADDADTPPEGSQAPEDNSDVG